MDFRLTEEEEAFRREVQAFLKENWNPKVQAEVDKHYYTEAADMEEASKEFIERVFEKGWHAMTWPKEYGGMGKNRMYQFIFVEEMHRVNAPEENLSVTAVGPTIMKFGTDAQKKEWLPKILSGEVTFALGYTEPHGGSDLANTRTMAVADGDEYVINGAKIFTSKSHSCTHVWLLVRTNPDVPKHKGLSLFIVPLNSPGVTIRPLWTLGDGRTNETFYDDVRVPKKNLIGERDKGWYYVTMALDLERVTIAPYSRYMTIWSHLMRYVKSAKVNGKPLAKDPLVRQKLAELWVDCQVVRVFAYRTAWMVGRDQVPNYEASAQKVFATELLQRLGQAGTQIMGLHGQLQMGDRHAPEQGHFEQLYRSSRNRTVGGGSNQIQRNVIAQRGLGLPR